MNEQDMNKFTHVHGTLSGILKNKVLKEIMLKLCKTVAVPLLVYGHEVSITAVQCHELKIEYRLGCTSEISVKGERV